MKQTQVLILIIVFSLVTSCSKKTTTITIKDEVHSGYIISPVNIQNVKLTDAFWLPIIKRVQEKTIDYAIAKCAEEGRFDNFLIAGKQMEGTVKGEMPFDDTDVYKIIEGASNSLISAPNKPLEKLVDSLINIIKIGQEADGYLTTWRTINPAKPPATWVKTPKGVRWDGLFMSHELYNAGHLYEAAAVHFEATGKRNFLDIAIKNANLMVKTFGDDAGKIKAVPGHQIIESGLIKLYQITKNEAYLNLAKYFLDNRGNPQNHDLFGPYSQDHIPVVQQKEVVGHAVRAVYMYAAMTDIAAIKHDTAYAKAIHSLWDNMVNKKMYLTGGIGSKHDGEAFGENYELPNLTAYNETCAAIGDVYWNHRLHNLTGNVKYFDVIERTLYNGLISGLSLDGTNFFYPNALESDGVYKSNRGSCTRQAWFDCSCCPTNVIRFVPSIPGLIYSKTNHDIYVNLYASNMATIKLKNNSVKLTQKANFPWNGNVFMTVTPQKELEFSIKLRIPGWSKNDVLPGDLYSYLNPSKEKPIIKVNGNIVTFQTKDGYAIITKQWKKNDTIELNFPMEVKQVIANSKVTENKNKVALEYGPLVYAIEEIDNKNDFDNIEITSSNTFKIEKEDALLGAINTIQSQTFKAIPYYAWSNRGVGKMKVWIPYKTNK